MQYGAFSIMNALSGVLIIRNLGSQSYKEIYSKMKEFTADRTSITPDELWFLEHPAIYTLGQGAKEKHVLDPKNIEVVRCNRGGQVTYHGPGQVICYLMMDLKRKSMGIKQLVAGVETAIVAVLGSMGIPSYAEKKAHGVYVNKKKIAALGFRVSRGCTYHGFSLNVHMDLEPFTRINPCGYTDLEVTDIFVEGGDTLVERVHLSLARELKQIFHYPRLVLEGVVI